MESTYRYRLIKASWGIAIDLRAELVPLVAYAGAPKSIDKGLWLAIDVQHNPAINRKYIEYGARSVLADLDFSENPMVLVVKEVAYNPCDFQPEGLACAIMGWMSEVLDTPEKLVGVSFDDANNRYLFEFDTELLARIVC